MAALSPRSRRARFASGALVVLAAGLSACRASGGGAAFERPAVPSSAQDRADLMAWALSEDLGAVRAYRDAAAMVAEVDGVNAPSGAWGDDLELLEAKGSTTDQGGALIEVRLLPDGADGVAVSERDHCYRYVVLDSGVGGDASQRVDCQDRAALAVAESLGPAAIADDAQDVLTQALSTRPDGSAPEVEQVRQAASGLVDRRGQVSVTEADGAVGVGIFVGVPRRECLLARRTAGGEVEAWVPTAILVAPGEASCDGETAAAGLAHLDPPALP